MKRYSAHGLAGCVEQKKCRATGNLMGLYVADQAGLEEDREFPWAAVCEQHGNVLRAQTLKLARAHMSRPEWCDECSDQLDQT